MNFMLSSDLYVTSFLEFSGGGGDGVKFSNRAMSHIGQCLWNDLSPEFRKFLVPLPSLSITHHHLPQASLSITPQAFYSKLKSHLFKSSYLNSSDPPPSNS